MKSLPFKLVTAALLLLASTASSWAQTRIATVDLAKVFQGYWKTKQADNAVKERITDLSKEDRALTEDLRKAADEYRKLLADANDQAVSAAEREKRKTAAEAKLKQIKDGQDNLQAFERNMKQTIDDQKLRMRDSILTEVRATINARAKSAGYSLVIDVSGNTVNGTPLVLFNTGDSDLTEAVLSQLNAAAPAETPAPVAKPAEKPPVKK